MRTFRHDGIAFSYLDEGTGPPVVFQHGLGGDATQAPLHVGAGHRLVCLECRGHGGTAPLGPPERLGFATFAGDLAALLDALGLDEVVLGGVSMGAAVALRLAHDQPERVRALVLVRPAWFTTASPPHLAAFPLVGALLQREPGEAARRQLLDTSEYRSMHAASPASSDSLLGQLTRPHAVSHAPVLERIPADRPLPGAGPWPQLAMPTLVLGCDRDPVHPLSCAEAWAQALPDATLRLVTPKTVDGARYASECVSALQAFLAARVPSSARG